MFTNTPKIVASVRSSQAVCSSAGSPWRRASLTVPGRAHRERGC